MPPKLCVVGVLGADAPVAVSFGGCSAKFVPGLGVVGVCSSPARVASAGVRLVSTAAKVAI